MKAKTNMEGKYIKKCAEVSVAQTQKRCNMSEKQLKDEIEVSARIHLQRYSRSQGMRSATHWNGIQRLFSHSQLKEFFSSTGMVLVETVRPAVW